MNSSNRDIGVDKGAKHLDNGQMPDSGDDDTDFGTRHIPGAEGLHLRVLLGQPDAADTRVVQSDTPSTKATVGWRSAGGPLPGQIDFRLQRRHLIREYQRGRLARHEVCDAHNELIRAANGVGVVTEQICPICQDVALRHVTYVFGPGLPAHGKCVYTADDFEALRNYPKQRAAYTVEVCVGCKWNHLARTFLIGGPRAGKS
jgi:hypothetical protein